MNEQTTQTIVDDEVIIATPSDDPKDLLRQAREMIPVGRTGAAPMNLAQQVDFAQTMAKARSAIPEHLKTNVGDCLAIVDIATRAGLSPYMVANKTYVQSGRLCFESQLYHAFAQASGLMKGDLMVAWEGEGDDLVCIVSGYLRGDSELKVHRSEKLKDAHPGMVKKIKDGVEVTFAKGSPLWNRKPKVQLFYDTSRDWVRMFAPRATLGIYTPDEIEEYGPDFARDVTPAGIASRLKGSPKSAEGHTPGHVESELAQVAANAGPAIIDGSTEGVAEDTNGANQRTTDRPKGKKKGTKAEKETKGPDGVEETAPAQVSSESKNAAPPKTVPQYVKYAKAWISACTDSDVLFIRWKDERKLRNDIGVTSDDRAPLDELIAEKRAALEK